MSNVTFDQAICEEFGKHCQAAFTKIEMMRRIPIGGYSSRERADVLSRSISNSMDKANALMDLLRRMGETEMVADPRKVGEYYYDIRLNKSRLHRAVVAAAWIAHTTNEVYMTVTNIQLSPELTKLITKPSTDVVGE